MTAMRMFMQVFWTSCAEPRLFCDSTPIVCALPRALRSRQLGKSQGLPLARTLSFVGYLTCISYHAPA